MFDACIILTRLNADLLAMVARSMGDTWQLLLPGVFWNYVPPLRGEPDLEILGLDQMSASGAELRHAYYRAAKAAHPDTGGIAEAFRTVVDAFERLTRNDAQAA